MGKLLILKKSFLPHCSEHYGKNAVCPKARQPDLIREDWGGGASRKKGHLQDLKDKEELEAVQSRPGRRNSMAETGLGS